MKPQPGEAAPDFTASVVGEGYDDTGKVTLSELRGSRVVLYFYPKDDTSGCTVEAVDFSARAADFEKAGAVVIGMSPDPVKKHDKFIDKHDLNVILASDEDKTVLEAYGVWVEKSMYGRKYMGVERTTLLIDGDGVVQKIWPKVKVPGHAEEVLEAARAS